MRTAGLACAWTLVALVIPTAGISAAAPDAAVRQVLNRFCVDCHSGPSPSGDRDFESLDLSANTPVVRIGLQEIADQLELGAMPPSEAEQPTAAQRKQYGELLATILADRRRTREPETAPSTLRRLTRREYRNTVRDLLGIDITMFDPTTEFPADSLDGSFDNNSRDLVTSGFLLEKYLQAADACVEKAFANLAERKPEEWIFSPPFRAQSELDSRFERIYGPQKGMILYDNPNSEPSFAAYGVLEPFEHGVPRDGLYEIRLRATAIHRDTSFGKNGTFLINLNEPFRLGIRPGDTASEDLHHSLPVEPLLAEQPLVDNREQWYTFRVPLSQGFVPRFTFENGQHASRGAIVDRIRNLNPERVPEAIQNSADFTERFVWSVEHGQIPQIRISEVRVRGPLPAADKQQRLAVRQKLFGSTKIFDPPQSDHLIRRFASAAFRRPISQEEFFQLTSFYETRQAQGDTPRAAYKATLKSILCRPQFLYFIPTQDIPNTVVDYASAERLAYFLTSTMPDSDLLALASTGELRTPSRRAEEARRLLSSPKSDQFVSDFLDNWLDLRSLGSMPPDAQLFRIYYQERLESAMLKETQLFFADLLARNAPAIELLAANHSFINRGLASLYGIENGLPPEKASAFTRVDFTDGIRGGLLGQASVLTVSANGIETSPVVRGVWLLDKIMGIPSPPPPANIPALDPDVRNATSIRDLLEKHRSSEACSRCHNKIDPLGYAWEEFNPVGQHRRAYWSSGKRTLIDSSGTLPWGSTFKNFREFRQQLLAQKEFFVRNLTTKLLAHALGRSIEPDERGAVDEIMAAVAENDYPLRDLIIEIVRSDLFFSRRN
jgi:hypothetical protein